MKKSLIFISVVILFSSCVAKRYLKQSQMETATLRQDSSRLADQVTSLNARIASLQENIKDLTAKIDALNNQNSQLGQQTTEQQNQLSKSKETLEQQKERLQHLQALLEQQKEQSEQLKNKMTEALKGFNSNDLSVYQKNGKVYVRLSENLLFPSGSAVVNPKGVDALA